MNENALKNAKIGVEMMKKVSAAWSKEMRVSREEKAVQKAFEGKIGDAGSAPNPKPQTPNPKPQTPS